jgi:hypothetical protein
MILNAKEKNIKEAGNNRRVQRIKKDRHFSSSNIVCESPGKEAMPQVIMDFVAPLLDEVKGDKNTKTIINIGVLVWNASLLSENRQDDVLQTMKDILSVPDPEWMSFRKNVIDMLFERKKKYFSTNRRMIVDYRFSKYNGKTKFDVASTSVVDKKRSASPN